MILAEKIISLRKKAGWSQEDLAERLDVSRQSVSKWESSNSTPDPNKIILLADIFEVSTDYLLRDKQQVSGPSQSSKKNEATQLHLEQASIYVNYKVSASRLVSKGVSLCVVSPIGLFSCLAMYEMGYFDSSRNTAVMAGLVFLLLMIAVSISFFIRTNQFEDETLPLEKGEFELANGIVNVYEQKLRSFRRSYNIKLSISIALFILAVVPILSASMLIGSSALTFAMINVALLMVAGGILIMVPTTAQYEAYRILLRIIDTDSEKARWTILGEKLAGFYWPLITMFYLAWSFWATNWDSSWIVWPIAAIFFVALTGLIELVGSRSN